jgi:sugar lactone lactonase YvrE
VLIAEPILNAHAELGEGAIWNCDEGVLHWVDINRFLVHSFNPKTGKNVTINVGAHVGTVVNRSAKHGGGFVVALPNKIAHVAADGKISVLANLEEPPSNRLNDGKCDPAGRFWFGSMDFDFAPGKSQLYMMDHDLKVISKLDGITISNGIVWTSDHKRMYYIDSGTNALDVFDYDIESGAISNRKPVVENKWNGVFDGMTIDKDDNLYIALWGGGAVLKIEPTSGSLIEKITVPGASKVTSCAFGGDELNDLYITSAAENIDPEKEPHAGSLFRLHLDTAKGVRADQFLG